MDSICSKKCRPAAKKIVIVATDGQATDDNGIDGRGLNTPAEMLAEHGKNIN